MDKELANQYWTEKDPRPLVEIIISSIGGQMRGFDVYYGRLYVIADWVYELTNSSSEDRLVPWAKIKSRMTKDGSIYKILIDLKPIMTNDGQQLMDVCDENGLYFITQHLPPSSNVNRVKRYLADAGVFVDELRRTPIKGMEGARETYLEQGKSEQWIEIRLRGKIRRRQFLEALSIAVKRTLDNRDYAVATDDFYIGLWSRTTEMLLKEMNLSSSASLRDNQSEIALMYTAIAERVCSEKLGDEKELNWFMARGIVQETARIIGKQAAETSKHLGTDIATNTPLSASMNYPRIGPGDPQE